jgi:hypothetical protein
MPICQGIINSGGFVADRRIRLIYLADKLLYQYDNIVPVLTIISPTGDDGNSGLTENYPKKTVKACVEAGMEKEKEM